MLGEINSSARTYFCPQWDSKVWNRLFWVGGTVLFLSILTLWFAYLGYPPTATNDGAWFIAPAFNHLHTDIKFGTDGWNIDPAMKGRFLAYPPLFPLFIGLFAHNTPQAVMLIACINVLVLFLSALVLWRLAPDTRWGTALIIFGLLLVFRASWSFGGRPETLVRLFFTLGLLTLNIKNPVTRSIIMGLLLGLTAATHVLAPVFLSLLVLWHFRKDLWSAFDTFSIAGITFLALVNLSPYSLMENVRTIIWVGKYVVHRSPIKAFTESYYIWPFIIFVPMFFLKFKKLSLVFPILVLLTLGKLWLFPSFLLHGTNLREARAQFPHLDGTIGLRGSHVWMLSDHYGQMNATGEGRFLIYEQMEAPKEYPDCPLIQDTFKGKVGYGFRVYDCGVR